MQDYGIQEIGVYIPEGRVVCADHGERLGMSSETLERRTGFESLARKDVSEDTSDMACKAIGDLLERTGLSRNQIDCLVVVTQNPDGYGLPQVSALVHGKLGWPESIAAFDVALGCSGYVYALSVVKGFLAANGYRNGILVTADPYSKIVDADDRGTAMIFGDAAAATLVSASGTWCIGSSDFGTSGAGANHIHLNGERKLRMNGGAVARCCIRAVPGSIERALIKNSLTMGEVDYVLLHQGSRYIVESIGNELGALHKTYFMAKVVGNTSSSSIPLALRELLTWHPTSRTITLSSFGVGLSWATTVISRREHDVSSSTAAAWKSAA
jgi:3-oxoacyl-[acyl-carrier-protein] synthase-3